jgi:ferredoxin
VQCGSCIAICPEGALGAKPGLLLQPFFFKDQELSRAEPATCRECGKIFGTRKSLEKVLAVLTSQNKWDAKDDLLYYCDQCRVTKLFESNDR